MRPQKPTARAAALISHHQAQGLTSASSGQHSNEAAWLTALALSADTATASSLSGRKEMLPSLPRAVVRRVH